MYRHGLPTLQRKQLLRELVDERECILDDQKLVIAMAERVNSCVEILRYFEGERCLEDAASRSTLKKRLVATAEIATRNRCHAL